MCVSLPWLAKEHKFSLELRSDLVLVGAHFVPGVPKSDVVENECSFAARAPGKSARAGLGAPWMGSHVATPPNASEPSQSSTKRSRTYTPFTTGVFETDPGGPAHICSCLHATVYPSFQGMQCITAGLSVMWLRARSVTLDRTIDQHGKQAGQSRLNPL